MAARQFAVMGHPIGHTMSPFIHERLFALAAKDGDYSVLDVAPEELAGRMGELNALAGYNITIPHKQRIIPYLDKLDRKAELYGSVNTVRNGAVREGFTTDPDGFLKALQGGGISLEKKVLLVGCGGVARTFAFEAVLAGCDLTIAVRPEDQQIQTRLAQELSEKLQADRVSTCLIEEIRGDYHLMINATPVGMMPETQNAVVGQKVLSHCANVFDAVYNPLKTMLLQMAEANGSTAVGGMAMLVWQAAVAHEIWDGSVYRAEDMVELIEDSAREQSRRFG